MALVLVEDITCSAVCQSNAPGAVAFDVRYRMIPASEGSMQLVCPVASRRAYVDLAGGSQPHARDLADAAVGACVAEDCGPSP
jgi:hypothetical protein